MKYAFLLVFIFGCKAADWTPDTLHTGYYFDTHGNTRIGQLGLTWIIPQPGREASGVTPQIREIRRLREQVDILLLEQLAAQE